MPEDCWAGFAFVATVLFDLIGVLVLTTDFAVADFGVTE